MNGILGPIGILLLIALIWSHASRSAKGEESQRETWAETKKWAVVYFYLYALMMGIHLFLNLSWVAE